MRELALPMLAINVFNVLTTHENERHQQLRGVSCMVVDQIDRQGGQDGGVCCWYVSTARSGRR